MSWRTVVITRHAKLDYKNNYLIVRYEEMDMIHLSEIHTLIVETTQVSITARLLCELTKQKIKVIFCDEKYNPQSEIMPYYGAFNTSRKIHVQVHWDEHFKKVVWTNIIRQKIMNQAIMLHKAGLQQAELLYQYAEDLVLYDETNREGHAAKVYFNALFGKSFSREDVCDVNAALDYGYTILLSTFNREVVASGYITQIGMKHSNIYNQFNLSSDLMEPFRIVVDNYVFSNIEKEFDRDYKHELVNLLNLQVNYDGKQQYLANVIKIYVQGVLRAIEKQSLKELELFQYP